MITKRKNWQITPAAEQIRHHNHINGISELTNTFARLTSFFSMKRQLSLAVDKQGSQHGRYYSQLNPCRLKPQPLLEILPPNRFNISIPNSHKRLFSSNDNFEDTPQLSVPIRSRIILLNYPAKATQLATHALLTGNLSTPFRRTK